MKSTFCDAEPVGEVVVAVVLPVQLLVGRRDRLARHRARALDPGVRDRAQLELPDLLGARRELRARGEGDALAGVRRAPPPGADRVEDVMGEGGGGGGVGGARVTGHGAVPVGGVGAQRQAQPLLFGGEQGRAALDVGRGALPQGLRGQPGQRGGPLQGAQPGGEGGGRREGRARDGVRAAGVPAGVLTGIAVVRQGCQCRGGIGEVHGAVAAGDAGRTTVGIPPGFEIGEPEQHAQGHLVSGRGGRELLLQGVAVRLRGGGGGVGRDHGEQQGGRRGGAGRPQVTAASS
ncbi:hypothetical protein GCM10020000_71420 [Streptomyces olivoverticillatus]